jgi:hypothetical protein
MSNLAKIVADYAAQNYARKGARFDVIVECYELAEIEEELAYAGVTDEAGAIRWADQAAGLHHEQELNQAWDGPESCVGSELYQPEPAACSCSEYQLYQVGCDCGYEEGRDDGPSLEERFAHYAFEERNGLPYGGSF